MRELCGDGANFEDAKTLDNMKFPRMNEGAQILKAAKGMRIMLRVVLGIFLTGLLLLVFGKFISGAIVLSIPFLFKIFIHPILIRKALEVHTKDNS